MVSASSLPAVFDVPIQRLDDGLDLPARIRPGDAAADLPSRVDVVLDPGGRRLVPTGFAVAIPTGACGMVLPRSGLALNHGVTLLNSPGLIDSGYRGELKVILAGGEKRYWQVKGGFLEVLKNRVSVLTTALEEVEKKRTSWVE